MRGGRSGLTSFRPKKLLDVNKMFHCKNVYFSYSICIYSVERSGKHRGISWMIMDFPQSSRQLAKYEPSSIIVFVYHSVSRNDTNCVSTTQYGS